MAINEKFLFANIISSVKLILFQLMLFFTFFTIVILFIQEPPLMGVHMWIC